jgi:hypothetical protein
MKKKDRERLQGKISVLLIGLALVLPTLLCASCTKEGNPGQTQESKASVQTVVERRVILQEPSVTPSGSELVDYEYCYRVSFDRHGNQLEGDYCDEERGFDYAYEYDSGGNIIKSNWYSWSSHDLELTNLYKYDSTARVIEEVTQPGAPLSSEPETRATMKYDRMGNMIEADTFESEGGLISKWTGRWEGGKLIESVSYGLDGAVRDKQDYKYNNDGQKIEATSYDSKLSLAGRETFQYDREGNEIEYALYNGNGSLVTREVYGQYEFDSNGQWTKRTATLEFNSALVWEVDMVMQHAEYTGYRTITYYVDPASDGR